MPEGGLSHTGPASLSLRDSKLDQGFSVGTPVSARGPFANLLDCVWLQVTEGVLTGAAVIESKLSPDSFKVQGAVAAGTEVEGL